MHATSRKASTPYLGATVHVSLEPDGFVVIGPWFRPPGFAGNVGWVGRDAGFTSLHIAEDPDGIFYASLVWINPVLTCMRNTSAITETVEKSKSNNQ